MSEPENFLERWSKRKLAKDEPPPEQGAPQAEQTAAAPAPAMETNATNNAPEVFDPASLPSIESIGADTDVTAFLRPGVPPDLTRAALRRAWSSDPAIRDFVGLVENGWDFNDPTAMAGFGPIDAGEAARLLAQAMGELPELAEKMLPELSKEFALRDAQDQAKVPVIGKGDASASPDSADVRRSIDAIKNDASQKESDG